MTGFQWILQIIDKASAPAKQAENAVGGFEKELKKAEEQIERIKKNPLEFKKLQSAKKELRELSGGSKSFAQRIEEMGAAVKHTALVQDLMLGVEAFRLAAEVGEKVVDVIYDIGKDLLNAAGGAERFKVAFQSMLGGEGAEDVLSYIEKIEKHTELSGAELKGLVAELLRAGFSAKELGNALPAALDIGGMAGGGLEKVQAAVEALAKIRESGKVSDKQLMNLGLGENADAALFKRMSRDSKMSVETLKKQMEAGKLDPRFVLREVYQTIAERQRGDLGTTAEKIAGTMQSKLKKLRELPERLFERWADTPGFVKFSAALSKILDKLDPGGPNGKKLFAALDRASMKLVELVDKFASGDGIDKFVDAVSSAAGKLEQLPALVDKVITVSEVLATIWAGSKIVGAVSSLIELFPGLATAAGTLSSALAPIAATAGAVGIALASVGYAIYKINEAIKELGGLKYVWQDFKDFISGESPAAATDKVNQFSPEWKKRKHGTPNAIELAQMDIVGLDQPAIPSQSRRATASTAMSQVAHVNIDIHAPGANADEIKEQVATTLPGALQQGFERMAISSGAM